MNDKSTKERIIRKRLTKQQTIYKRGIRKRRFNYIEDSNKEVSILEYASYPADSDWNELVRNKKAQLDNIGFDNFSNKINLFDFAEVELTYWKKEFNNRAGDLQTSYVMMMHYYKQGIPDDEWYISPGKKGNTVDYFPHFNLRHFGLLYWYGFYLDGYLSRFTGLIDSIYHLINAKYDFRVKEDLSFKRNVLSQLKNKDRGLHDYLDNLKSNGIYKKTNEIRNSFMHNYRPNQIDSGLSYSEKDGSLTISFGIGQYTTTTEILKIVEDSIDLLSDISNFIKQHI